MGIEFSERQMKILYFLIENEHTTYKELSEILYLIFDYPYKHYTFKYFEV